MVRYRASFQGDEIFLELLLMVAHILKTIALYT